MNGHEYIISKQIQWALNHNIKLVGSEGIRGRKAYTKNLNENLFEPLMKDVEKNLINGSGNELTSQNSCKPKMHAVHSSSTLAVNIFQFWQKNKMIPLIAAACGFCRKGNKTSEKIVFEDKYPIDKKFRTPPNIDVVIYNSVSNQYKVYAIECKFSEAYGSRGHKGVDPEYLSLNNIWEDIPNLYKYAKLIESVDTKNKIFHPAQIVKHILGLKKEFGKDKFRLLYLWYDCLGKEGTVHREEIQAFKEFIKEDRIHFHELSYQELIIKLADEHRISHEKYINYITDRYL